MGSRDLSWNPSVQRTRSFLISNRIGACIAAPPGTEVYEPHFMYVGHRYVEVHGFPGTPTAKSLQQRVVHSDVEAAPTTDQSAPRRLAGSIAFGSANGKMDVPAPAVDGPLCYEGEGCSGSRPGLSSPAVLDQISHNVRWTLIDNLHSVPEDCDQ